MSKRIEVIDMRQEVDDAVRIEGDWVFIDFSTIGPVGHPSHYQPHLFRPGHAYVPRAIGVLSKAYKAKLKEVEPTTGLTHAELIAESMVATAIQSGRLQVQAASELADRTEGKARQSVDVNVNVALAERISKARRRAGKPIITATPLSLQS